MSEKTTRILLLQPGVKIWADKQEQPEEIAKYKGEDQKDNYNNQLICLEPENLKW
jgi:hypothetical protein